MALTGPAFGQTVKQSTWDGGGANNDWTTALNWADDAAPTETTNYDRDLVFDGVTRLSPNFDSGNYSGLSGGFNVRNIVFPSTAGAFILTESASAGFDMLGNRSASVESSITNNSSNLQTFDVRLISRADLSSALVFDTASGDIRVIKAITGHTSGGNIVKRGSQTLTFTAANAYVGTTTVQAGTLALDGGSARLGAANNTGLVRVTGGHLSIFAGVSNGIADVATISLDGGGTPGVADTGYLELGSGVSEQVFGLRLNGVDQFAGTYGSTASAATFKSDEYFSGTGVLNVVPEPASLGLLGITAMGLCARRRRRGIDLAR